MNKKEALLATEDELEKLEKRKVTVARAKQLRKEINGLLVKIFGTDKL